MSDTKTWKAWEEMTDLERDTWVARTFGLATDWGVVSVDGSLSTSAVLDPQTYEQAEADAIRMSESDDETCRRFAPFAPEPDVSYQEPATDYAVLKRVRETWPPDRVDEFVSVLEDLWGRTTWGEANPVAYTPGNYSEAAYETLRLSSQDKP